MIKSSHITAITIAGIIATAYFLVMGASAWLWIGAVVTYFVMGCLGITITFHRFLAHNSFKFRWKWMEKLFIIFGSLAGTGSAIGWVAVHKAHHKFSDRPGDPHSPRDGFIGFAYDDKVNYRMVKSLLRDPMLRNLHRDGLLILGMYYVLLFVVGGPYALAFFGVIPQMMVAVISAISNYFSHSTGYQTYETNDQSRNTWWLAVPTWGEAWHNNHHAKPNQYSFKHKWWEFDISGSIISLIKE